MRTLARLLAGATLIALVLYALPNLSRILLRQQLDATAAETLGALIHATSPHRWVLRRDSDVVAGRAFGTDDAVFEAKGFRLRSQGRPIDVGLVISSGLDLQRYPRLTLGLDAEDAGTVSVLVRETLSGPVCTSTGTAFGKADRQIPVALDELAWTCDGAVANVPGRAAMLRLRVDLPAGLAATLIEVEALPSSPPTADSLDQLELPLLPSPRDGIAFDRALARIAMNSPASAWPVLQLPFDGRVEQILVARDKILDALPDAVVVVSGDFAEVANAARAWRGRAESRLPSRLPLLLLGIYGALLVILRLKPPLGTRLRAALELLGVVCVPVWLVLGGSVGDNIDPVQLGAGGITLAFALSLLFGGAPAQPSRRTLKRGWWIALGSLALSLALILAVPGGILPTALPGLARVSHYLAWAALQQFLICVIIAERIEKLAGAPPWGMFGAALIFALLHAPNAMLMQLTFVGGLIWVWNWQRHRALLANICAHAACGLLLTAGLPKEWLHSAEVSARFFLVGT